MYGKTASFQYKGRIFSFIVWCTPKTTQKKIKSLALHKLKRLENEYPHLTLEEIVYEIRKARL